MSDDEEAIRAVYRIYVALCADEIELNEFVCHDVAESLMPVIARRCRAFYPVIGEDMRDGMANAALHEILKAFERRSLAPKTVQEMDLILAGAIKNGLRKAYRDQVAEDHPPVALDDRMVDSRSSIDEAAVEQLMAELPERVYAHVAARVRFKISDGALRYAVDALLTTGTVEPALLASFGDKRARLPPPLLRDHIEILVRDALYRFRAQVESGIVEIGA